MKRQPILFSTGRFIDLNCMKRILSLWGIYDMHKRACFQSTAFGDRPAYVDTSVPFQERTNTMCDYFSVPHPMKKQGFSYPFLDIPRGFYTPF